MIDGQINAFDIIQGKIKLIKATNGYEITRYGNVYGIHFYDKKDRDKCRVTKNFDYIKKFL